VLTTAIGDNAQVRVTGAASSPIRRKKLLEYKICAGMTKTSNKPQEPIEDTSEKVKLTGKPGTATETMTLFRL